MNKNDSVNTDLKIIVIGCSGTGKTSLVHRWIGDNFDPTKPTIASEFSTKIYKKGEIFYRVHIWDLGGQDKSAAVTKIFAKDSHGCVVVCDINNEDTLEQTASWKSVVEDECVFTDGKPIPFLLLRNKVDMVEDEEKKKEFEEETKNFCDENEFVKSFLTSAKENINVNESMSFLLDHIIQRLNDYLKQGNEDKNNIEYRQSVRLSQAGAVPIEEQNAKKKCC